MSIYTYTYMYTYRSLFIDVDIHMFISMKYRCVKYLYDGIRGGV